MHGPFPAAGAGERHNSAPVPVIDSETNQLGSGRLCLWCRATAAQQPSENQVKGVGGAGARHATGGLIP